MEEQFQTTVKADVPALGIKELFFKYVRFLPLFILSVALSLLAAYLYLRYTPPVYKAGGALLVKQDNSTGGSSSDPFQQMFVLDNSINIQNEIEVLLSRPLMERVVQDLGLNLSVYSKGKIAETNLYRSTPFQIEILRLADSNAAFTLKVDIADEHHFRINDAANLIASGEVFKTAYGTFRFTWDHGTPLSAQYRVAWLPAAAVTGQLISNLVVAPKGNTGTLLISLEASHPQLAADVVNQLMKEYQVVTREDKNETNRRMLEFIDGRLQGVQKELDSVTGQLLTYQNRNDLINPDAQSQSYFTRIEATEQEIISQQVQDNVAQMVDNYLRDTKNKYNLVPSSLGLADATLNSMITGYNQAQTERKFLIDANVPLTSPRVQQKADEIERLRLNILESLRVLRRSIQAAIGRLQETSSTVRGQMRSLPAKEQNMLEIKMQQQTKQAVFNLLMQKREQTAISLAGTISNMKILEPAGPNFTPVKPNRRFVQLIAISIGLVLPALFIFILELLNDKINNRYDIERVTDAPIIGEVGHDFNNEALVIKTNNRGIVAEQFRIIRSNLQYFLTNNPKPVILVTSSFSGEGKSFISTNLGAVMALAGKKTIVLEFDIRKPKILSHLGLGKQRGLINYLLGKASLEELPVLVPGYDNLFVFPCGPVPPNPAELLLDSKVDTLFAYLRQTFDVVVIDTAPVGIVSDAMTLSRFADSTLYIVRQNHTFKKQIGLIDEFHREGKLPKVSVILNDVRAEGGYSYYGGGRYSYGYSYGSGYFEDEGPPPTLLQRWFGWLKFKAPKAEKNKV